MGGRDVAKAPGDVPFLALEAYNYMGAVRRSERRRATDPRYVAFGSLLAVLVLLLV